MEVLAVSTRILIKSSVFFKKIQYENLYRRKYLHTSPIALFIVHLEFYKTLKKNVL